MYTGMRFQGTIKNWNDDRGFGFIEPIQGGQELFVHIKAFQNSYGRPEVGAKVSFEVETNPEGKKRAVRIEAKGASKGSAPKTTRRSKPWDSASLAVLGIFALSYLVITLVWGLSWYVGMGYLVMSVVCAGTYWLDKDSAKIGAWRVSESTLLTLGLLCGWPGAIVAQHVFQHKTTKPSFRIEHWGTVVMNLAVFYVLTTPLLPKVLQAFGR